MSTLNPTTWSDRRRFQILLGLLVAIAALRLWLDFLVPTLPVWMGIPLLLVPFGIGYTWRAPRWTLCGLLVYCASPIALPSLAIWAVALGVAGAVTHSTKIRLSLLVADLVPGIIALLTFSLTLSPGLLPADAGEFQVVAATWGVAHPPGYALYTILAGTMAHLFPFGTPAWRVNFLSAIIGALTVMIVSIIVRRETGRFWAGWLAGLMLMVAVSFWMTATQASIRPLTALFEALMIEAASAYRTAHHQGKFTTAALVRFGAAAGLGVTHHGSLIFTAITLALAIALVDLRAWRRWTIMVGAALIGFLPWLYLPIRAGGFLAPADLGTWNGFLNHVLARGFAGDMFAYAAPSYWPGRWDVMVEVFRLQWQPWIVPLALCGLIVALIRSRWLGGTLIAVLLVHTIVVGTYRAPQTVEYALPAYVVIAIGLGLAVNLDKALTGHPTKQVFRGDPAPNPSPAGRGEKNQDAISTLLAAAALAAILFSFGSGWLTMRRSAATEEARETALSTLTAAPDSALVLANWHRATPLWYLQHVEGTRSDVEVQYVYPQGAATPQQTWNKALQESVSQGRQVIFLQNYPEIYRALPYTLESQPGGYRALPTTPPIPLDFPGIPVGPNAFIADWKWLPGSLNAKGSLTAGQTAHLQLTWYLLAPVPFGAMTTFVHLGADDQPPFAQLDLPIQAPALDATTQTGAITVIYDLFIPATTPPGEWHLFAGAYTPSGPLLSNGQQRVKLGSIRISPALYPMPTQHPISGGPESLHLTGWDYDNSVPGTTLLYLHWELRGLTVPNYSTHIEGQTITLSAGGAGIEQESPGYWTSVITMPPATAQQGVQVKVLYPRDGVEDIGFDIPPAQGNEHYIPFGDIGVLVGWKVDVEPDRVMTRLDWLASGASYDDMTIQISAYGDGWGQSGDFAPVAGSIPTLKWAYESLISSQQTLALNQSTPPKKIKVLLYNSTSGREAFIWDTRLTMDGPGVQIGP